MKNIEGNFQHALMCVHEALSTLSIDADEQIRYLNQLGVGDSADELALEFDDAYKALTGFFPTGRLRPEVVDALRAVDAKLKEISGPSNSDFWRLSALSQRQEWRAIRNLSAHAKELISPLIK